MNDEEYNKVKEDIKKEVLKENQYLFEEDESDFSWRVGFLSNIKDKNNKKEFVNFVNLIKKIVFDITVDKCIWHYDKNYIRCENMPSFIDFFGIINDRIKSNKTSLEKERKEEMENKKKLLKCNDTKKYDSLKSDLIWNGMHIDNYEKEINFLESMKRSFKEELKKLERKGK